MDFKREAVDKLKCYAAKQQSLQHTTEEIKRLEEELTSIHGAPSDSIPVSGGGDQNDGLVNNIALRAELAKARRSTRAWLCTVDEALKVLSEEEFRILDKMYIHPRKGYVEQLCGELHIEKSALYTRKNTALRKFTLALYGVTEQ